VTSAVVTATAGTEADRSPLVTPSSTKRSPETSAATTTRKQGASRHFVAVKSVVQHSPVVAHNHKTDFTVLEVQFLCLSLPPPHERQDLRGHAKTLNYLNPLKIIISSLHEFIFGLHPTKTFCLQRFCTFLVKIRKVTCSSRLASLAVR